MALIPPKLRIGDTIGVITPSAQISDSPSEDPQKELDRGITYLKSFGFEVQLGKHALDNGYFGAGKPQERANDINQMFADPQIHALIATHGGVYSNSVLPLLDFDLIKANPKILMGFSDISTLQLGIHAKTGLVTFHGNMVMYYFGMEPQEYDRQEFLTRLVYGEIGSIKKNSLWRTIRGKGFVEGKLLGGNDWVLQWLLGTPYYPDFSDSILFIEVPGFTPYMLYNRLHQFKQAGLFDQIKGLVIGYAKEKDGYKAEDIFLDVAADYDFPIVKTDDFGHNSPNTTLPIGTLCQLNADTSTLILTEPCVKRS